MLDTKILVVDDDPNINELLKIYFANEGYDVKTAADGIYVSAYYLNYIFAVYKICFFYESTSEIALSVSIVMPTVMLNEVFVIGGINDSGILYSCRYNSLLLLNY